MTRRGKTPSLIGGGAGACKFEVAKKKRTCKRCQSTISGGTDCVEVNIPSTMGIKTYCIACFKEILAQTQKDLDGLKAHVGMPA
ncbi:MAG: hypothetical protein DRQ24_10455 [Candidatus Latescibacterota bacterium]|nr:MAG: hypothetical protein DRQ24_10455 [Candidatus Latescibacterota bacterium]